MRCRNVVAFAIVCSLAAASIVHARSADHAPTSKEQAQAFFDDGVRKQQAGDYAGAIRAYAVSLTYDPKQAEALSNRGFCYKQLKHYPKALADSEAAIRLKPKLAAAHQQLGEMYLTLGQLDAARQAYETLLKLDRAAAAALKVQLDAATPTPTP